MDRNGNIDPSPAQLEFSIVLPWYREGRLVLIACTGAAAALFFGGLAFNRHRRLVRSYAEVEHKVAERTQQLEAAGRQLMHSQKMNALGTLAAGIAHDFNNILSIIRGSAQIIEDNMDNPEKIRIRADRIRTAADQGAGIVKAMLGFSRDSGEPETMCDLNTTVEETLRLLGDRFLREVRDRVSPDSGPAARAGHQGLRPANPAELHLQRGGVDERPEEDRPPDRPDAGFAGGTGAGPGGCRVPRDDFRGGLRLRYSGGELCSGFSSLSSPPRPSPRAVERDWDFPWCIN